jgi:hypothetical protein
VSAQGGDVERERQAAEDHHHYRGPVNRWLLPLGQGLVGGGETAGGNRRHGVVDRVERAHARAPEGQAAEQGDADIGGDDVLGDHVRAWQDLFRAVRGFGLEQAHAADPQHRQDRHGHGDEADAAQPVQQRAPDEDARGHVVQPAEHGGAGGGDSRHAFEEGIGVADVLLQDERQGGEDAYQHPARYGEHVHVPRAQVDMLGTSRQDQAEAGDEGGDAGPDECLDAFGTVEGEHGQDRDQHAGGQSDQEDADDETEDT